MPKTSYKRKKDDDYEEIRRKIRRLEAEISAKSKKRRHCRIISSSESEPADSDNDSPHATSSNAASAVDNIEVTAVPATSPQVKTPASENQTSEPSTGTAAPAMDAEAQEPELDQEVLALLGDAPKVDTTFRKATHNDLASRWQEILKKGLPKEAKDKILQDYLIPENCDLLVAPVLNPEVKSMLADSMVKRDFSLMTKQKQVGIAIAAINQAIELLISKESHTKILKPVSDACRLLYDLHHDNTNTRRGFAISSINPELKEAVSEAKRDKYLFGKDLSENLKTAKSIKKAGTDLKQPRPDKSTIFNKNNFVKTPKNFNDRRLNWKTLPRKTSFKPEAGKPRHNQGRASAAVSSGSQQRGMSAVDQPTTRTYRKR